MHAASCTRERAATVAVVAPRRRLFCRGRLWEVFRVFGPSGGGFERKRDREREALSICPRDFLSLSGARAAACVPSRVASQSLRAALAVAPFPAAANVAGKVACGRGQPRPKLRDRQPRSGGLRAVRGGRGVVIGAGVVVRGLLEQAPLQPAGDF